MTETSLKPLAWAERAAWTAAVPANAGALWMVFGYAPVEQVMGEAQKIFYYHVPSAVTAYCLVFLAFLFSALFLWRERAIWDVLAHASAEVGWVFLTVVLLTGPIWGRSAWGRWWVWEPRLTTALILWLMYTAYVLLRLFTRRDARSARVAAVLAVVAFFNVPLVHKAVEWWGSVVHPEKVSLEPPMRLTFLASLAAVLLLGTAFTLARVRVGLLEERRLARMEES